MNRSFLSVVVVIGGLLLPTAACARATDAELAPAKEIKTTPPATRPTSENGPRDGASSSLPRACQTPSLPQTGLRTGAVIVHSGPDAIRVDVEIAETEKQRTIGMMCRTEMKASDGMLFVFDDERPRSFWMKNTLLFLDMVFLDASGRVVGVVERATPLTLDGRSVAEPAKYVLELQGGAVARMRISVGETMNFENIEPKDTP